MCWYTQFSAPEKVPPKSVRNLGTRSQKGTPSPALGRKRLRNTGLRGRRIINLPTAPACLGLTLIRERSVHVRSTREFSKGPSDIYILWSEFLVTAR